MTTKKSVKSRPPSRKTTALARREGPARTVKKITKSSRLRLPPGYAQLLDDLKDRIRRTQVRAAVAANRELITLYWHIGRSIVTRQREQGWGNAVVARLSRDLQAEFPGVGGFSPTNIWRMRAFYLAWCGTIKAPAASNHPILPQPVGELDGAILPQPVAELEAQDLPQLVGEIPWGHNAILLEKLSSTRERIWYARKTIEHGWSRAVLTHQIETRLYHRQGKATTNFHITLPPDQSDLAQQALKDPYLFDFLTLADEAAERELERGLVEHIRKFLLELGVGFAFVGSQYHLEVEGEDFYIDLLFYHLRLRCYVVIDLKTEGFKPDFAGKMSFYLAAVDDLLRHPDDKPTIGLILCKTRKRLIAEYALRHSPGPIGVANWEPKLVDTLPKKLQANLPTIKELEKELGKAGKRNFKMPDMEKK